MRLFPVLTYPSIANCLNSSALAPEPVTLGYMVDQLQINPLNFIL